MEKNITLRPYDRDVSDDVFSVLFYRDMHERPDGLTEIPAASYQLVISALELMRWEVKPGAEKDALNHTIALVEYLRDEQKDREWMRREMKNKEEVSK